MKIKCITQYYASLTYGNIYEGYSNNENHYKIQDDDGLFNNFSKNSFIILPTPLQYWAELNGLEEGDRFTLEENDQLGQGEKYIYKNNNIKEYLNNSLFSLDWEKQGYILLENLKANKLPKVRTITIDEKEITISEESYQALKKALKED